MIFPYDDVDMEVQLGLLAKPKNKNHQPFIFRYVINDLALIQILQWDKHQKPHHTEKKSVLPEISQTTPKRKRKEPKEKENNKGNGDGDGKAAQRKLELTNGDITDKEPLEDIVYPNWLNITLWNDFKNHRKEIKAPMSIKAENLNISTLKKLIDQGHNQQDVINQSIANHWKGLFPVKDNQKQKSLQPTTYAQAQDAERRQRADWLLKEMQKDDKNNETENFKRIE